jgi:hypothetical protein
MPRVFLDVDPRTLHVSPSRPLGADLVKLALQIARFGTPTVGMPVIEVVRGRGGRLAIFDGMTRATRVARLLPGRPVRVEVTQDIPNLDLTNLPTIGDLLP